MPADDRIKIPATYKRALKDPLLYAIIAYLASSPHAVTRQEIYDVLHPLNRKLHLKPDHGGKRDGEDMDTRFMSAISNRMGNVPKMFASTKPFAKESVYKLTDEGREFFDETKDQNKAFVAKVTGQISPPAPSFKRGAVAKLVGTLSFLKEHPDHITPDLAALFEELAGVSKQKGERGK